MKMYRYESKHKQMKNIVENTKNFRNINKTMAIRHQEWLVAQGNTYVDKISHTTLLRLDDTFVSANRNIFEIYFENQTQNIYEIKSVKLNNYEYQSGFFVVSNRTFHEIRAILWIDERIFFVCKMFRISSVSRQMNSSMISEYNNSEYVIRNFDALDAKKTYEAVEMNSIKHVIIDTTELSKKLDF